MKFTIPSVTVAVPAFNHSRYVVQALDSILDSGIPDLEIVICDDASTDETASLASAWGQRHAQKLSRFELLRHDRNAGLCQTLNDVIAASTGELIHLIASDDFFLPGGLFAKTAAMAEHPEWQAAFCDGRAVGPAGETYAESLVENSPFISARLTAGTMCEELLYHWAPPAHQLTWRRSAFQVHGGDFAYDPTVFCEDLDSALWAASRGTLGFVPRVCQAYRCRSWPQTTDRSTRRECRDQAYILAKYARKVPQRLAAEFTLKAAYYENMALGDTRQAEALWKVHHASREAYRAGVNNPGSITTAVGSHPLDQKLTHRLMELEESERELKSALREARRTAKKQEAVLAELTKSLKSVQHLLRYHSLNPGRALRLWWNRNKHSL